MSIIQFSRYNNIAFTCESVADLRAVDPADIIDEMVCFVAGQTFLDDGKGGIFRWNNASTANDDGLDVVQPTGLATGRWHRFISNNSAAPFVQSGTGAVSRNLMDKVGETLSVLDFGADRTGATDSTAAFVAAAAAAGGGTVFVPRGTYRINQAGILNYAGVELRGEGGFKTIIKPTVGAAGPLIYNSSQASGTSSLARISNLYFDLEGLDITALDLGSVNRSLITGCFFNGGTNYATRAGRGIRFQAPLLRGSYDNIVSGCSFQYLGRGAHFDNGGNANELHGCNFIVCDIGVDSQPTTGEVDTPRVFGGRIEGCRVGLNEGATYGHYFGIRFEASVGCDVNFATSSTHPRIFGGYTASSAATVNAIENSVSPQVLSDELGEWNLESSAARPRIHSGKITFGAAGSTAAMLADAATKSAITGFGSNYSVFFYDPFQIANNSSIEAKNDTNDNTVQVFTVDTNNRLNISSFNRKTAEHTRIFVGPNWSFNPNVGLEWAGVKVLGPQGAAVADAANAVAAPTQAEFNALVSQVNTLLARLRAHGIIAT